MVCDRETRSASTAEQVLSRAMAGPPPSSKQKCLASRQAWIGTGELSVRAGKRNDSLECPANLANMLAQFVSRCIDRPAVNVNTTGSGPRECQTCGCKPLRLGRSIDRDRMTGRQLKRIQEIQSMIAQRYAPSITGQASRLMVMLLARGRRGYRKRPHRRLSAQRAIAGR